MFHGSPSSSSLAVARFEGVLRLDFRGVACGLPVPWFGRFRFRLLGVEGIGRVVASFLGECCGRECAPAEEESSAIGESCGASSNWSLRFIGDDVWRPKLRVDDQRSR